MFLYPLPCAVSSFHQFDYAEKKSLTLIREQISISGTTIDAMKKSVQQNIAIIFGVRRQPSNMRNNHIRGKQVTYKKKIPCDGVTQSNFPRTMNNVRTTPLLRRKRKRKRRRRENIGLTEKLFALYSLFTLLLPPCMCAMYVLTSLLHLKRLDTKEKQFPYSCVFSHQPKTESIHQRVDKRESRQYFSSANRLRLSLIQSLFSHTNHVCHLYSTLKRL